MNGDGKDGGGSGNAIAHTYVVLSGKGGVGKSTVSAAVAATLAWRGARTGLLDSDLHGPTISKMLGVERHRAVATEDERIEPVALLGGALKMVSIQFLLGEPDTPVIWRGPLKHKIISQLVESTCWGTLDYLIVDSPPGTGDEPLSVAQTAKPEGAIVVTTPQDVAAFDVRKSIAFCNQLELPVVGIVENMGGFVCPHCGERTDIFGRDAGARLAKQMGVPLLGALPIDPRLVTAADQGKLLDRELWGHEIREVFDSIVEHL